MATPLDRIDRLRRGAEMWIAGGDAEVADDGRRVLVWIEGGAGRLDELLGIDATWRHRRDEERRNEVLRAVAATHFAGLSDWGAAQRIGLRRSLIPSSPVAG